MTATNGKATASHFKNKSEAASRYSPAQTTTTAYNPMMQATNVVQPDGTTVTSEYALSGELKKTYGSRTYPVEYTYDAQGRMKTQKTWQNYTNNSGTKKGQSGMAVR